MIRCSGAGKLRGEINFNFKRLEVEYCQIIPGNMKAKQKA